MRRIMPRLTDENPPGAPVTDRLFPHRSRAVPDAPQEIPSVNIGEKLWMNSSPCPSPLRMFTR
jgi:hypothetical protein